MSFECGTLSLLSNLAAAANSFSDDDDERYSLVVSYHATDHCHFSANMTSTAMQNGDETVKQPVFDGAPYVQAKNAQ